MYLLNTSSSESRADLSVVIPAHNEEANLEPLIRRLLDVLKETVGSYEIVVVNDGSTDKTAEVLQNLQSRYSISVIEHDSNRGYGAALKSGFAASSGKHVAFIDGDGQLDPDDLSSLFASSSQDTLALGYRKNRQDPPIRILLGKIFSSIFVPVVLNVRVKDVDCALKVIPKSLLDDIELQADGALINAELLAKARRRGYKMIQLPVNHLPRTQGEQSGAKLTVIFRVFFELLKVRRDVYGEAVFASLQTE